MKKSIKKISNSIADISYNVEKLLKNKAEKKEGVVVNLDFDIWTSLYDMFGDDLKEISNLILASGLSLTSSSNLPLAGYTQVLSNFGSTLEDAMNGRGVPNFLVDQVTKTTESLFIRGQELREDADKLESELTAGLPTNLTKSQKIERLINSVYSPETNVADLDKARRIIESVLIYERLDKVLDKAKDNLPLVGDSHFCAFTLGIIETMQEDEEFLKDVTTMYILNLITRSVKSTTLGAAERTDLVDVVFEKVSLWDFKEAMSIAREQHIATLNEIRNEMTDSTNELITDTDMEDMMLFVLIGVCPLLRQIGIMWENREVLNIIDNHNNGEKVDNDSINNKFDAFIQAALESEDICRSLDNIDALSEGVILKDNWKNLFDMGEFVYPVHKLVMKMRNMDKVKEK